MENIGKKDLAQYFYVRRWVRKSKNMLKSFQVLHYF